MCTGTVVCNDMFDCIEKKSLVKESSYNYDYISQTTQKFSKIRAMAISEAYELSEDGLCPKNCADCDINKKCKVCKEGYDCINDSDGKQSDDDDDSHTFLWVFLSIVGVLLVAGIIIAIYLIFKKKKVEESVNAIEMIAQMKK